MEREIQNMKKKTQIIFLSILLFFITIVVFYPKHNDIENEIPDYPIPFSEVHPEIYPDKFLSSYRYSHGILEYGKDKGNKYRVLSSHGVYTVIFTLYNIDAVYIQKVNLNTLEWKYKASFANNEDNNKQTDCVVYLTSTSIIVNGYEYYIKSGTDHLLEVFDWYYTHEDFGETIIK